MVLEEWGWVGEGVGGGHCCDHGGWIHRECPILSIYGVAKLEKLVGLSYLSAINNNI